jgi:hypothetical protein
MPTSLRLAGLSVGGWQDALMARQRRRTEPKRNVTSRRMERPPAAQRSLGQNLMLDDDRFSAVVFVGFALTALILTVIAEGSRLLFAAAALGCSGIAAYVEFVGTPGWAKVVASFSGNYRPRRPARQRVRGWR